MIIKCQQNQSELSGLLGMPRKQSTVSSRNSRNGGKFKWEGQKKLFTEKDVNKLSRIVKANGRKTLQDITSLMNENMCQNFCKKTISRKLADLGHKGRVVK